MREFTEAVKPHLETARDELAPMLEPEGALGKMPAFGVLDNAPSARSSYNEFHQTMWTNTQKLIEALEGLSDAVTASADDSDESEALTTSDVNNQDG
ncbi:hypothetical protein [Glycomyces buryatensis]|uniref:PE domain-containing protein n=1 Tax=Glycomyces buryatensis TaxID=2570927 RepID=A0A4V4HSA5_9ACTN|nr:hypothetical protein [Glycomyces buryatensis]THV40796.1 hypothetical protein FAB82_14195 [Glycomyces buryatensis]